MHYPATFKLDLNSHTYIVCFRDIPEALTQAYSLEEAKVMAKDALIVSMEFYFEDHRPVPLPSKLQASDYGIRLPVSIWAKVLLLNTMLEQKITQAELARRLGKSRQEMQRIFNLHHTTKIDTIAEALLSLGKTLNICLDEL